MKKFLQNNAVHAVLAAVLFVLTAVWAMGGFSADWMHSYAGTPGQELEGWMWRYWWAKKMVSTAWESGASPLYMFWLVSVAGSYPETGNLFDLFVFSWPLEKLFGSPFYFNIKVVLIFVLNGISGWCLGRYFFKDKLAALVCGFVLVLNPYCTSEIMIGRVRQAILFPMAFYCMALDSLYRDPSWKKILYTGFWGGFSTLIYLFYGQSVFIFTVIFLLWAVLSRHYGPMTWRRFGFLCAACLAVVLVAMPSGFFYIKHMFEHGMLRETVWLTDFPQLDSFVNPSRATLLEQQSNWLNSMQRFRFDSMPWQYGFMEGYPRCIPLIVTILSIMSVPMLSVLPFCASGSEDVQEENGTQSDAADKSADMSKTDKGAGIEKSELDGCTEKSVSEAHEAEAGFSALSAVPWLLGGLLFYGLSLGPYLIDLPTGEYVNAASGGLRGPHVLFFKYMPAFSRLFSPVRMCGMMYVCLSVLCGAAVYAFANFCKGSRWLIWTAAVLTCTCIAGSAVKCGSVPITRFMPAVPDCYKRLCDVPGNFTVASVPLFLGDYHHMYQITHGKRLLGGWQSGSIPGGYPRSNLHEFCYFVPGVDNNSFVKYLKNLNVDPSKKPDFAYDDYVEMVAENDLRLIFVHERSCWSADLSDGKSFYDRYCATMRSLFGDPVDKAVEKVPDVGNEYRTYEISVFRIDGLREADYKKIAGSKK